jgi:hypothetical protein
MLFAPKLSTRFEGQVIREPATKKVTTAAGRIGSEEFSRSQGDDRV